MTILSAQHLSKSFGKSKRKVIAVDDVSLTLERASTLAIVGESGAGKSTVGRLLLRLIEPDTGRIEFDGHSLRDLPPREMRRQRRRLQMIFQDPSTSLDPLMTVGQTLEEAFRVHFQMDRKERLDRMHELLAQVGLGMHHARRRPVELSGGQIQRVSIARALACQPDVLVCDEPVSALDVSIGAQITNLLLELQSAHGLSLVYISHDLRMVKIIADEIVVMRGGRVVESGNAAEVFHDPASEYTRELLEAIPGNGAHRR